MTHVLQIFNNPNLYNKDNVVLKFKWKQ